MRMQSESRWLLGKRKGNAADLLIRQPAANEYAPKRSDLLPVAIRLARLGLADHDIETPTTQGFFVTLVNRAEEIANLGNAKEQGAFGVLTVPGSNANESSSFAIGFLRFALEVLGAGALLFGFGRIFAKGVHVEFRQGLQRGFILEFGVFGVNGLREGHQVIRVAKRNVDTNCFTSHTNNDLICCSFPSWANRSSRSLGEYSGHLRAKLERFLIPHSHWNVPKSHFGIPVWILPQNDELGTSQFTLLACQGGLGT